MIKRVLIVTTLLSLLIVGGIRCADTIADNGESYDINTEKLLIESENDDDTIIVLKESDLKSDTIKDVKLSKEQIKLKNIQEYKQRTAEVDIKLAQLKAQHKLIDSLLNMKKDTTR